MRRTLLLGSALGFWLTLTTDNTAQEADSLRRAGNPFRNYFARNPDDEVCARYHVSELFAVERSQVVGVVDLYRSEPATHSEIIFSNCAKWLPGR